MSEKGTRTYHTLSQSAESKQQQAYEQIREDILNNTYPEGTVMVERKLCEIYQVSRSPIRNALQKLNHEGLLSFVPGKGMVVASFTTEDILEVYDLIEVLQVYAVNICIANASPPLMEALGNAMEQMKATMEEGDLFQCTRWDQRFHELLVEHSQNSRLKNIYQQLSLQQMRFMTTVLDDSGLAAHSLSEHEKILTAIREKDAAAAEQCIHAHYRSIKQHYVNKLLARL